MEGKKPLEIILDSCGVFKLLNAYKIYDEFGDEGITDGINFYNKKIESLKEKILSCSAFEPSEYKKTKNVDFVAIIKENFNNFNLHMIKSIIGQKINDCEKIIKRNNQELSGQYSKYRILTPEKIEQIKKDNAFYKNWRKELTYARNKLAVNSNMLCEMMDLEKALKMFQNFLNGEYKFYLSTDSIEEIKNHIINYDYDPTDIEPASNVKQNLDKKTVLNFIKKYCNIISIKDEAMVDDIVDLSNAYRNMKQLKFKVDKQNVPMANDIGSTGIYADSVLMAIANLVGMNFISFNEKDFIYSDKLNKGNKNIRNYIARVNKYFISEKDKNICSEALPYGVDELLNGDVKEINRNKNYVLVETEQIYTRFSGIKEYCLGEK